MLGGLVIVTIAATGCLTTGRAADLSALLAGLHGIDLASGKLVVQALVWLAVLAEAVVLYQYISLGDNAKLSAPSIPVGL